MTEGPARARRGEAKARVARAEAKQARTNISPSWSSSGEAEREWRERERLHRSFWSQVHSIAGQKLVIVGGTKARLGESPTSETESCEVKVYCRGTRMNSVVAPIYHECSREHLEQIRRFQPSYFVPARSPSCFFGESKSARRVGLLGCRGRRGLDVLNTTKGRAGRSRQRCGTKKENRVHAWQVRRRSQLLSAYGDVEGYLNLRSGDEQSPLRSP